MSCFLKSTTSNLKIQILNGVTKFVGRTPEWQIRDTFCSRNQLSIDANLNDYCVTVKVLGNNPSALNGFVLEQNKCYKAYHGDVLEIVHNNHFHEVVFDPPPPPPCVIKKEPCSEDTGIAVKRSRRPSATKEDETGKKSKTFDSSHESLWRSEDGNKLLIFTSKGVIASDKIAAYDIDGTIILTQSGNVFPKSSADWRISFPEVPGLLKSHIRNGYKVVFFTNQAGMSKGKTHEGEWKKKLEHIVQKLNIPVQVFVATGNSIYRKPKIGMWKELLKNNDNIAIDVAKSWYVGDAAGRPERKLPTKRRKDHSLADRLFAANLSLPFFTPEEHFLKVKTESWTKLEFDPKQAKFDSLLNPKDTVIHTGGLQVILMVGSPGSGKSHFTKTLLKDGFFAINQDELKTWKNCVAALRAACERAKSTVIDNTNMDTETRKRYIVVAKEFGARCRCFVMNTTHAHARHNIAFRELVDPTHSRVPDHILNMLKKKYQEPTVNEGFSDIVRVNCIPTFDNAEHKELYNMFLANDDDVKKLTKRMSKINSLNQTPSEVTTLAARGYKLMSKLGEGSYAKVYLAEYKLNSDSSSTMLACKVIDTKKVTKNFITKFLPRELDILVKISHPHIIHVHSIFQRRQKYFIFMRYAESGDLLDMMIKDGAIAETQARFWVRQIALALQYLHKMQIAHRDIKCENILVTSNNNVKLCDFGFTRYVVDAQNKKQLSETFCGSLSYAAPEILKGLAYAPKVSDMWAFGVMVFTMLNKAMPFDDTHATQLYENQMRRRWKFGYRVVDRLTSEVKTMVRKLLEPDVRRRLRIDDVVNSSWFKMDARLKTLNHYELAALKAAEKVAATVDSDIISNHLEGESSRIMQHTLIQKSDLTRTGSKTDSQIPDGRPLNDGFAVVHSSVNSISKRDTSGQKLSKK